MNFLKLLFRPKEIQHTPNKRASTAENINQIFIDNGLPPIPKGTPDWYPLLLANIEALAKRK